MKEDPIEDLSCGRVPSQDPNKDDVRLCFLWTVAFIVFCLAMCR